MTVAETILRQLGGRRFIAMTGAKNLHAGEKHLSFRIPRAKNGIMYVKITLTPDDLYDIEFGKMRKFDYKIVKIERGVYFDQLQAIFTQETGLDTHL